MRYLASTIGFAGFEVLCGNLFTGFPWLSLGTSFAFLPVWVQGASLIGGYGLSALLAASACFAAAALSPVPAKHRIASAACSAVLLLGLPAWGMARQGAEKTKEESPPFSLIMVQGNIDQSRKWEPAFQRATLARYMNLSEQALRNARSVEKLNPILLLWPETAMPFYFPRQEEHAEVLRSFAADNEIGLAFGAPAAERDENAAVPYRLYNRLYLLSPSGKTSAFYDKRHLVPFGEFIPFAADFPFLRSLLQGMDFSPGTSSAPLPLTEPAAAAEAISPSPPVLLGVLICYEAIFPSLARERVAQGANVLVNISNDGWFRRSSAPWQHLSHAVLRAVEQGRPLLRATNTGVSALIDGTGRIVSRIDGLFTADTLTVAVRPVSGTTFFHRIFPAPEIFLAALALFSLFGYKLSELIQHRNSHVPVS